MLVDFMRRAAETNEHAPIADAVKVKTEFKEFNTLQSLTNFINLLSDTLIIPFGGSNLEFLLILEELMWREENNFKKEWFILQNENCILTFENRKKKVKFIDMEFFITSTTDKLAKAFEILCPALKNLVINYLPYKLLESSETNSETNSESTNRRCSSSDKMTFNKEDFNYNKFPETVNEDPSNRYTKLNFDKWYNTCDRSEIKTKDYIKDYAKTGLKMISLAITTFRKKMLSILNCDVFDFITKSQYIWHVFLNSCEYPLMPYLEFEDKTCSRGETTWLEYLMSKNPISIQHKLRFGQKVLIINSTKYYPDGFSCIGAGTIYEYYGCYFHGCPKCFPNAEDLYNKAIARENIFIKAGYKLITIWDCEFKKDEEMRELKINKNDLYPKFSPRKAYYAGLNDIFYIYYSLADNYFVCLDIHSCFPAEQWFEEFPYGDFDEYDISQLIDQSWNENWFGVAYVRILPPRNLLHPFLIMKHDGKTQYTLCRQCIIDTEIKYPCAHNNKLRALIGTFSSVDINYAISLGYKVLEIYYLINFHKKTNQLFRTTIKPLLELKAQCDGPSEPAMIQEYCDNYKKYYDIELDPQNVKKNPSLKEIVKGSGLTSLSGRTGLHYINKVTEIFSGTEKNALRQRILSPDFQDLHLYEIIKNEKEVYILTYKTKENLRNTWKSDVFLGLFITSYSRITLHKVMHLLGEDVVYTDTDSVKFRYSPENMKKLENFKIHNGLPILGNLIGQFGKEFEFNPSTKKPRLLKEICVLNRKQYGLKFDDGSTIIKLCGISSCEAGFNDIKNTALSNEILNIKQSRTRKNKGFESHNIQQDFNIKSKSIGKYIKVIDSNKIQLLAFGYLID